MKTFGRMSAGMGLAILLISPVVTSAQGRVDLQSTSLAESKNGSEAPQANASYRARATIFGVRPASPHSFMRGERTFGFLRAVPRYILHHKELLLADGLVWLAESADAASTVHCLNISPLCKETNGVIGSRPSAGAVWGTAIGYAAGATVLNHLLVQYEPDSETQHALWVWCLPMSIAAAVNARSNSNTAERLQSAGQLEEHMLLERTVPLDRVSSRPNWPIAAALRP